MLRSLRRLWRDERGAAAIETAIAAPVLALISLGAFQVSTAYSRQHELQTGADDAASMALAGWTTSTGDTDAIKAVLMRTLNLADSQVTIVKKYRCDAATTLIDDKTTCGTGSIITTYLRITLTDTYTPTWTHFGLGSPINFNVRRTVLVP